MKLEIIKEEKFNEPTWYFLKVDNISYKCSKDLEEIEIFYNHVKNNPHVIISNKTVIKSEEI